MANLITVKIKREGIEWGRLQRPFSGRACFAFFISSVIWMTTETFAILHGGRVAIFSLLIILVVIFLYVLFLVLYPFWLHVFYEPFALT